MQLARPSSEVEFPKRLPDITAGLAARLAARLESHRAAVLVVFSVLYWIATLARAHWKGLWYDEVWTYHVSRLASVPEIWNALKQGLDQQPPLSFVLTHYLLLWLGTGNLAMRLPAMLGVWLMSLCLFHFVARRTTAVHGVIAMLLPFATEAAPYAYEARPYGMLLGMCGVALVCWQHACDGARRTVALVGLALALAAAISLQYYAVAIFMAFGIAELVRWIVRRRIDWAVLAAMCAGAVPMIFWLPLVAGVYNSSNAAHWWRTPAGDIFRYGPAWYLAPLLIPLLVVLTIVGLWRLRGGGRRIEPDAARPLGLHELVLAVLLMWAPLWVLAMSLVTHAFHPRYAIEAVIGLATLVAFAMYRDVRGIVPTALVAAVLLGWFCAKEVAAAPLLLKAPDNSWQDLVPPLPARAEEPVAFTFHHDFVELGWFEPPSYSRRVYLTSREAAMRFTHHESEEHSLIGMSRLGMPGLQDYDTFLMSHGSFYTYGEECKTCWLVPQLLRDGARVEMVGRKGLRILFHVTFDRFPPRLAGEKP